MGRKSIIYAFAVLCLFTILLINLTDARVVDCNLDKPLASWQFNEGNGTNAQETCFGYNTTFYGSMEWTNSTPYGNALKFNGVDSFVDAGNFFNKNMQEFSFSLWTNISYQIAYQTLFQSGNYNTNEFLEALQINEGDNDYVIFMNAIGNPPIDDGVWHNIAGTFNGSDNGNVSLYIDGVLVFNVLTYQAQIDATANLLYFGVNYANGFVLNGLLDEMSFYNRTLTKREVKDLFEPLNQNNNLSIVLYVPQYPYVDFNSTYLIQAKLFNNMTEIVDGFLVLQLSDGGVNTSIDLPYNAGSGYYEVALNFDKVGDYPFVIEANAYENGYTNTTGTFLVRKPYYIDVLLFTNNGLDAYINDYGFDYGFVTAEYLGNQKINPYLESFIHPFVDTRFVKPTLHSTYTSGQAQLKLFEKDNYVFRFVDGQVQFDSTYAKPNITKSYGDNIYLGTFALNGTNSTYQFVLNKREMHPYFWLSNWLLFIILILAIVGGVFMFFLMPDKPYIALVFTILVGVGAIAVRIFVFFWFSW